jgi:hypothetical protein
MFRWLVMPPSYLSFICTEKASKAEMIFTFFVKRPILTLPFNRPNGDSELHFLKFRTGALIKGAPLLCQGYLSYKESPIALSIRRRLSI